MINQHANDEVCKENTSTVRFFLYLGLLNYDVQAIFSSFQSSVTGLLSVSKIHNQWQIVRKICSALEVLHGTGS
jgi:hypothetical protein